MGWLGWSGYSRLAGYAGTSWTILNRRSQRSLSRISDLSKITARAHLPHSTVVLYSRLCVLGDLLFRKNYRWMRSWTLIRDHANITDSTSPFFPYSILLFFRPLFSSHLIQVRIA